MVDPTWPWMWGLVQVQGMLTRQQLWHPTIFSLVSTMLQQVRDKAGATEDTVAGVVAVVRTWRGMGEPTWPWMWDLSGLRWCFLLVRNEA